MKLRRDSERVGKRDIWFLQNVPGIKLGGGEGGEEELGGGGG